MNPFSYPVCKQMIDISGKRTPVYKDYVIRLLTEEPNAAFYVKRQFDSTLQSWDHNCEYYIANHIWKSHRRDQYLALRNDVIQSNYEMFQFVFYRNHTRYKQIDYQRYPYVSQDVDYIASYTLKDLLSMVEPLQKRNNAFTDMKQADILSEKNGNYAFGEKPKDYFDRPKPLKSKPKMTDTTSKLNTDALSSTRPVYFDDTLNSTFLPVYPEHLPDAFNAYLEEKLPMTLDVFDQVRKQYEKQWIPGCYVIYDMIEKKYYVGQAKDVWGRVQQHISGASCKNKNPQTIDVNLKIKKHQAMIRVIKIGTADIVDLNEMERRLIAAYDSYRNGYNLTKGNG